ncbi:MAG: glycosyl transferase family 2 [Acidimicrobiales bacterium]|nr:glycosyl transferase family 2 [Acidimicrobiales bacterium]
MPPVSVVLAVRNGARTIDAQLAALAAQEDGSPWELVVSDNGSTDGTPECVERWADRLPVRVVDASRRPGPGHARNVGVAAARGRSILMCDADDVVAPRWRGGLATALQTHELATGPLDRETLNAGYDRRWGGPAITAGPRLAYRHLVMIPGGNLAFRRTVFDDIGGFDPSLRRGEDVDFVWRALRKGARIGFADDAVVQYRLRATGAATFRQGMADGYWEPRLFKRHRGAGMAREGIDEVGREYRHLARALPRTVLGRSHSHAWAYDVGQRLCRVAGSARHRCVFL